jgi:3-oxoacyl-[acyl-carrier-protein] synthase III
VQRDLGLRTVGALDVRNQCSGFVYAVSVADQYIKTGMYKNILVVVLSTFNWIGYDNSWSWSFSYFWRREQEQLY